MVQPANGLQRFMSSKSAPYVGMILAAAMGLVFIYTGLIGECFGGLIIAVLLYVLPKSMGANFKKLAVFGVLFFVVASVFGAFAVSKPMILDQEGKQDRGDFRDIEVTPFLGSDGEYTFYVTYDAEGGDLILEYNEASNIWAMKWGHVDGSTKTDTQLPISGNEYEFRVQLDAGKVYYFQFKAKVGSETKASSYIIGPVTMSDSDLNMFCLQGNLFGMGFNVLVYFAIILLFTAWMRKNLERTRERLEREGRLYPQGYGRCKECQTIVLPGEVVCRKCGAYIDIPEELRVKKTEFFECSDCGREVPAGADVCPACGAGFDGTVDDVSEHEDSTQQTFTCSECGKEVRSDADVCPHCGERFED